jgi:crossover junction endodeoxyribonuclease RuvC
VSNELERIIDEYKPNAIGIEELFFSNNAKTAINVGQGRGAVLVTAAKKGYDVYEYTPLQVKQAVTGYGRADKKQVQIMVKMLLKLKEIPKPDDAADALAVALCHAQSYRMSRYY